MPAPPPEERSGGFGDGFEHRCEIQLPGQALGDIDQGGQAFSLLFRLLEEARVLNGHAAQVGERLEKIGIVAGKGNGLFSHAIQHPDNAILVEDGDGDEPA